MTDKNLNFGLDKTKSAQLTWQKRLDIIMGIARGLLYIHQDSRLRIIHRDLKASNILLDEDMNPKISDFGTARIFKGDQNEENTRRVIGTYGYMSPEYAMEGIFSVKSDVFSFGVIVLEILSGKKNRMLHDAESSVYHLGHVWKLWEDGRCLELLDESMGCPCPTSTVLRCMQVGLLCVQERSEDRPTMAEVIMMLSNEAVALPQPNQFGSCVGRTFEEGSQSSLEQSSSALLETTSRPPPLPSSSCPRGRSPFLQPSVAIDYGGSDGGFLSPSRDSMPLRSPSVSSIFFLSRTSELDEAQGPAIIDYRCVVFFSPSI